MPNPFFQLLWTVPFHNWNILIDLGNLEPDGMIGARRWDWYLPVRLDNRTQMGGNLFDIGFTASRRIRWCVASRKDDRFDEWSRGEGGLLQSKRNLPVQLLQNIQAIEKHKDQSNDSQDLDRQQKTIYNALVSLLGFLLRRRRPLSWGGCSPQIIPGWRFFFIDQPHYSACFPEALNTLVSARPLFFNQQPAQFLDA